MREIGEIELAIQGGTEKIEQLGTSPPYLSLVLLPILRMITYSYPCSSSAGEQGRVEDSMKELAAVEALKAEKSDKEVRTPS